MNLDSYIENLRQEFMSSAEIGGKETADMAERLIVPLEPSIRLAMFEVLSAAAAEITVEVAPSSVEVRLNGRDPELVVNMDQAIFEQSAAETSGENSAPTQPADAEDDEGNLLRTTVRFPESLKGRIEAAAAKEGISLNTWLVRAATAALEKGARTTQSGAGQHFVGWA